MLVFMQYTGWAHSHIHAWVCSYLGNEADVKLYLNNTGLMWESAPQFRALLVFAEHRCLPTGAI